MGYKLRATSAFARLKLLSSKPPVGTVSTRYSAPLRAEGGIPFYDSALSAGSLPTGLSLEPFTGEIQGVPERSGTFDFTVRIRDYERRARKRPDASGS